MANKLQSRAKELSDLENELDTYRSEFVFNATEESERDTASVAEIIARKKRAAEPPSLTTTSTATTLPALMPNLPPDVEKQGILQVALSPPAVVVTSMSDGTARWSAYPLPELGTSVSDIFPSFAMPRAVTDRLATPKDHTEMANNEPAVMAEQFPVRVDALTADTLLPRLPDSGSESIKATFSDDAPDNSPTLLPPQGCESVETDPVLQHYSSSAVIQPCAVASEAPLPEPPAEGELEGHGAAMDTAQI